MLIPKAVKKTSLLALFFIFTSIPLYPESPLLVTGYFKNFSVIFNFPQVENDPVGLFPGQPVGMVNNRLRLNLNYQANKTLSFAFSYSLSFRIQDNYLFSQKPVVTGVELFRYRFDDLRLQLYPSREKQPTSFALFQNLDRAYCTVKTGPADIYLGRQAIAWGSARVLNPTDVIAPFTFDELDTEDRIGVDALRIRIPLGFMGEIDSGWVFGEDFRFSRSAAFIRGKFYIARTDVSLLLLNFQENLLVGWDLARSIGGAGFWLEGAYVLVKAFKEDFPGRKQNYLRFTTGLDYSFSSKIYGFLEYHYSGAGVYEPGDYLENISRPGVAEGSVYLMGKHYLAPGLSWQITPLLTLSGQALLNLTDSSCFIAPSLDYNIAENIYLAGGAFIGAGKKPALTFKSTGLSELVYSSEFGGYPDIFFTSFRIYF